MAAPAPHPANVPGDFYVELGRCTMCEIPLLEAPQLFGVFEEGESGPHCYVKRQPESFVETDQMCRIISLAELGCIRYRATDRLVQLQLLNAGAGDACDRLPRDLRKKTNSHRPPTQFSDLWTRKPKP